MRIDAVELEWFRGAADPIALPVKGKSVVVYGPNGAGKSSFVDAIEYFLRDGKIGHLTHEYSGKKQEKEVINTHTPALKPTRATLQFADGSRANVNVKTNGTFSKSGDGLKHVAGLDYRRVVLRQDEVAAFISSAKGEKYSALLPLLGLEELEFAAENIRQLSKRIAKARDLDGKQHELNIKTQAAKGASSMDDVESKIAALHVKYRGSVPRDAGLAADCLKIQDSIRERVAQLTPDVQRHAALRNLAVIRLETSLDDVQVAEADVAASSEKLLDERIGLLDNAGALLESVIGDRMVCPACGSDIERVAFGAHLASERRRLATDQALLHKYRTAVERLVGDFTTARTAAISAPTATWWSGLQPASGESDIEWLKELEPQTIRGSAGFHERAVVRARLVPMIRAAERETVHPPPGTEELLADSETVRAASAYLATTSLAAAVAKLLSVVAHLDAVESKLRMEIRERSDAVIADISTDIQRMWGILHPGHEIEDVRLRHPDETDKAIDIELKFFGVELKSPRLTLSEGNRNSLGLCVFLSMARRAEAEVPVILDDVVVSLDRDHRGMIVELLQKEFHERQVALFTHDRDWFAELKHMLEGGWEFHTLMPYSNPAAGIAWSSRIATLDDARVHLDTAPDTAANIARKIMDTELGFLADKLRLRMEYRQGLRNDLRMSHEFLVALAAASKIAFQRKDQNGTHAADADAAILLQGADNVLMTWGNKGSHTFDVVRAEAAVLLGKCEGALAVFRCDACSKYIYKFDDGNGTKQCECGSIRWRYGKL